MMRRVAKYGLSGGIAIGTLAGVIAAGPHVHETALALFTVLGSAALGGAIGYASLAIITRSLARGEVGDGAGSFWGGNLLGDAHHHSQSGDLDDAADSGDTGGGHSDHSGHF
jgi:hypothetical protein